MTWPLGWSEVRATVSVEKPSWRSLASALAWSAPTTFGTLTSLPPEPPSRSAKNAIRPPTTSSSSSAHSHQRLPSRSSSTSGAGG